VRLVGQVIGSLMGHSFGFELGLKLNHRSEGFRMGRVSAKPKSKKAIEVTGLGLPLVPEAGSVFSMGFRSTSGLQRPERTSTINLGGKLSTPSCSELFVPLEGAGYCLMVVDLSVSEGLQTFLGRVLLRLH